MRGRVNDPYNKWIDNNFVDDLVDIKMAQIMPEDDNCTDDSHKLFDNSNSCAEEEETSGRHHRYQKFKIVKICSKG